MSRVLIYKDGTPVQYVKVVSTVTLTTDYGLALTYVDEAAATPDLTTVKGNVPPGDAGKFHIGAVPIHH